MAAAAQLSLQKHIHCPAERALILAATPYKIQRCQGMLKFLQAAALPLGPSKYTEHSLYCISNNSDSERIAKTCQDPWSIHFIGVPRLLIPVILLL
jgi:hypothetical protein